MNAQGALPETHKRRVPRKPPQKLPPTVAHELAVARAARMGIDISYMQPDERCKYPSKFCCNVRARKSTGKLHRFCENHRSRANVNQKRWNQVRRLHEQVQQQLLAPVLSQSGGIVAVGWLEEVATPAAKTERTEPTAWDTRLSPNCVTAAWPSGSGDLSDGEIDVLVAMVLNDEDAEAAPSSQSVVDQYWSWHPQSDAETPTMPRGQGDASLMYTLETLTHISYNE